MKGVHNLPLRNAHWHVSLHLSWLIMKQSKGIEMVHRELFPLTSCSRGEETEITIYGKL